VSSFCDQHDWGGGDRSQTRQLADSSPDCRRLSRDCQLLETGDLCDVGSVYYLDSKKLSYRRGTARCVVSVEKLASCHATVQKLLVRQVLNQLQHQLSLINPRDKIVL